MAPIRMKEVICFSSQDSYHKVDNLLNPNNRDGKRRWLCAKDDKSGHIEAEFELEKACRIKYIDIGNSGTQYLEILVGRSMWPLNKEYPSLLPCVSLMAPEDCRSWTNRNSVKMFQKESFYSSIAAEEWDRIKVVCRQSMAKDKQFGLSFINLVGVDSGEQSEGEFKSKSSSRTSASKSGVSELVNRMIFSSGSKRSLHGTTLSQSEKYLHAALSKQSNNKPEIKSPKMCMNPLTKKLMTRNTKKLPESDSSDTEGFGSPPSPTLSPPAFQILSSSKIPGADQGKSTDTPMRSHTNQNRTGQIKRQESTAERQSPHRNREKKEMVETSIPKKFKEEVRCFLDGLKLRNLNMDFIKISDLRLRMERQRGSPLTQMQKRAFKEIVTDEATKILQEREGKKTEKNKTEEVVELDDKEPSEMFPCPHCYKRFTPAEVVNHAIHCTSKTPKQNSSATLFAKKARVSTRPNELQRVGESTTTSSAVTSKPVITSVKCPRNCMKSRQALWVGDSQEDVSDRIKPLVTPTTSAIEPFGKEKKNTAEEETPSSKQKCPLCNQLISKCITDIHSSLCQGPSILSKIADDEDVSDVEELPVQEYRTTKPASDVKNNNYKNNSETTFTAIKPSNSPICSTVAVMPSFASCHASNFMCANTPATSAHNLVQCPLCMAEYPQSVIQMHANLCLENSVVY